MEYRDTETQATSFPKFLLLPRELRLHIWETSCPEICPDAILSLDFNVSVTASSRRYHTVRPGSYLQNTVREIRIISAVHRESRAMIIRALPDTLSFRAWQRSSAEEGIVRFRKERDLVYINGFASLAGHVGQTAPVIYHLVDFADRVENLVVMDRHVRKKDRRCLLFLSMLSNLKRVYYCQRISPILTENLKSWQWATSDICNMRAVGYLDYDGKIYSWPKAANVAALKEIFDVTGHCGSTLAQAAYRHGWDLIPMAYFQGKRGFKLFDILGAGELPNAEPFAEGNPGEEGDFSDASSYRSFSSGSTSDYSQSGAIRTSWWVGLVIWADTSSADEQAGEGHWHEWAQWAKEAADEEELETRLEIQRMAELQAQWAARVEEQRRLLAQPADDEDQERVGSEGEN